MDQLTKNIILHGRSLSSNLNCLSVLLEDINAHSSFLELRICTFHHIIINMFLEIEGQVTSLRKKGEYNTCTETRLTIESKQEKLS